MSLTLSPAQRAALRADAHALRPVVLVGAEGLTEAVLAEIEVHLRAHQLIKVRCAGEDRAARGVIFDAICERFGAAPIQMIGKVLVLWRAPTQAPRAPRARGAPCSTPTPSAVEARGRVGVKGAPRMVRVVKASSSVLQPKPQNVLVRGNERVTAGGTIKKAKKRLSSVKRQRQAVK